MATLSQERLVKPRGLHPAAEDLASSKEQKTLPGSHRGTKGPVAAR